MIEFDNLTYLHGKPQGTGLLKANPEDFVVVEDLGFEPDGEGEHILVRILKNGCNTRFVADALAKFLKIHAREVSFAGQKDKHAVTEQWLCARVPGKEMPDLSAFQLEGCQVLEYARHKRKLRLGALKGNAFTLVLREVSNRDDVEQRLNDICVKGVPNYFGAQRFGIGGSNLQGAQRWAQTNTPVRDRNKRSFCKTCVVACPYGAMEVVVRPVIRNSGAGLNVRADKAEANKCDLCNHREDGPACMAACPTHALICVDRNKLEQLSAEKRRRTALMF